MDEALRRKKQTIRAFLRSAYNDERLAWLLAHIQSGKLSYNSCCCLIGIPTAKHYLIAIKTILHAISAEWAFRWLGSTCEIVTDLDGEDADAVRRRRLLPIVKAEMKRRSRQTEQNGAHALDMDSVIQ